MNYYNEHDPKTAAWLRELIKSGLIPNGDVDERSITEISPRDLSAYTQCHFFAGIGGWSLALQLAGWPSTRPVWTGSCPCQPFSSAGKGLAQADERHLWPVFFNLIRQCRPECVFGEQVASAISHGWLDGISADLEAENYTCGAAVLGAHSVSAPHIRQRLYWMAYADGGRLKQRNEEIGSVSELNESGGLDNSFSERRGARWNNDGEHDGIISATNCQPDCWMGEPIQQGLEGHPRYGDNGTESRRLIENEAGSTTETSAASGLVLANGNRREQGGVATTTSGHRNSTQSASSWDDYRLANCRDGKSRRIPTEPAFQPLAHGIPARVVRLRGYGNAIVPAVAATFIQAFQDYLTES